MLKLSDLALRPDLQLGPMLVSPSRRLVEGPGGHAHLEPLIMQVFLLLLDANGKVVTRAQLFDQCWGGVIVGDDSLNRAIAKLRRIGAHVAPGLFEIETIPRTGYRLTGQAVGHGNGNASAAEAWPESEAPVFSRRSTMLLGGATVAALAAGGAWIGLRDAADPRFTALMARGDEAFRDGTAFESGKVQPNASPVMIDLYRAAVASNPDSARAWGLLAYFKSAEAEDAPANESERLTREAQQAIHRALDLDPDEPNARVGMFLLEGRMLDWAARDRALRSILATDPANLLAMTELMPLLQAAGLTRESWVWNEKILRASPFARPYLVVRAMKLWILGRIRESDSVIDRVRGLWPDYPFGYWIRFLLFSLTGRPQAALAMLESAPERLGGVEEQAMWRTALRALDTRAPAAVEAARAACIDIARTVPSEANDMVMVLAALGETEAAFDVAEGFLLWRGRIISTNQADGKAMDDYSRRMTQWLFTPPVAPMRADPRFARLCDEFGLAAYWRARGIKPDYLA